MPPRVTVLMPVYNAGPYLLEAVNSIITGNFRDFELLAIDDGSTDESDQILRSVGDRRLRVVRNFANMGVVFTLNRGMELAQGELIARMDADDVSMPERLARQVAFLDANQEVGLTGTWARTIGASPRRYIRTPLSSAEIHANLFAFNSMCHPTVMLRKNLFAKHKLCYSEDASHAEDLDLWMRASNYFRLANLPVIGLRYRMHVSQVSKRFEVEQHKTLARLRKRQLLLLMPRATDEEIGLHLKAFDVSAELSLNELIGIGEWLQHLEESNRRSNRYDESAFHSLLVRRWLNAAHRCMPRNLQVWKLWRRSQFSTVGVGAHLWLLSKMGLSSPSRA